MIQMTTIRVDEDVLKKAQKLGINVSRYCENSLKAIIATLEDPNTALLTLRLFDGLVGGSC